MTKLANGSSRGTQTKNASDAVLAAIDLVVALCRASLPDAAVEREIRELHALRSASELHWPLDMSAKSKIDLGPFAAKNISDWNPELADTLMRLDYSLRHDGERIEQVVAAATPTQEAASLTL